MKISRVFFLGLVLIMNSQAYRFEVDTDIGLAFEGAKNDRGEVEDADEKFGISAKGTFYFNEVETDKGALEEAAFLNKASSLFVSYDLMGEYYGLASRFSEGVYGKSFGLGGSGVINDYVFLGEYHFGSLNGSYENEDINQSELKVGFGKYLTDLSMLTLSFFSIQDTRDYIPGGGLGVNFREDKGLDLAYKQYVSFQNSQSLSYGGNLILSNSDIIGGASGLRWGLKGFISYFPTTQWVLGAALDVEDFSDDDYDFSRVFLDATIRYYFVESFSMGLNAGYIHGKDEIGKVSGVLADLGLRFRF